MATALTDLAKLGKLILQANPYEAYPPLPVVTPPPVGTTAADAYAEVAASAALAALAAVAHPETVYTVAVDGAIEVDDYTGKWDFKNVSYRLKRAIRIPYSYLDEKRVKVQDYLLIGYEGRGPG